jgi:hypothetical protein
VLIISLAIVGAGIGIHQFSGEESILQSSMSSESIYDTSDRSKVVGFADDVVVGVVSSQADSLPDLYLNRYKLEVEESIKGLKYPDSEIVIAQTGGRFELNGKEALIVPEQPILEAGGRYLVALRYENGYGYFAILSGPESVIFEPTAADIESYRSEAASAEFPSEASELKLRVPISVVPAEGLVTPTVPEKPVNPYDAALTDAERRYVDRLADVCKQLQPIGDSIEKKLAETVDSSPEILKEASIEVSSAIQSMQDLFAGARPDPTEVRTIFVEDFETAESALKQLSLQASQLADLAPGDLVVHLESMATQRGMFQQAMSGTGVDSCRN